MAAQPSVDDSFTFVGGLFTEGSFFLTPKNSWKEGDNVIPNTDGSVVRRPALDFEANHQVNSSVPITTTDIENKAYCVETWTSVGGNGNLDFFVVQNGSTIEFFKAFSGTVGANKLPETIDLNTYKCFGNTSVIGTNVITTTSCYGRLLITSIDTNPILVTYNTTTGAISHQAIEVAIRDFDGYPSPKNPWEELTPTEWAALDFYAEAEYNLYNQGWKNIDITTYAFNNGGRYPANTKSWWYGKDTNDNFDPAILNKQDFGTSWAPRGRYVINAFYQNRYAALRGLPATEGAPASPGAPINPGDPNHEYGPIRPTDPNGAIP